MPAAKRLRDGNQIGIEDLEASHAAGDATSTVPYSGRDFSGMKTRERLSIYRTEVNETPAEIAKKLDIDLPKFLAQNLAFYPSLTRSAKIYTGGSVDLIEGEVVPDDGYLHKNARIVVLTEVLAQVQEAARTRVEGINLSDTTPLASIAFLDYIAAFDSIDHCFLDEALRHGGASDKTRAIIRSIYKNASAMVSTGRRLAHFRVKRVFGRGGLDLFFLRRLVSSRATRTPA